MPNDYDVEQIEPGPKSPVETAGIRKLLNPGAWTAIFTGILVVFSALLWRVNDKANETSIATQRAFISFTGPIFISDIKGGKFKGINVYYGLSNSGTTPASGAVLEWNMSLGPIVPQKGADFDTLPQNERMSLVLGPKAGFQVKPVYLSVDELEMVADGKKHLFFWAWITYRDIFSGTPTRLSEVCTDITSATWTARNHTVPSTGFKTDSPPCPIHNCYDQECEDYATRTR